MAWRRLAARSRRCPIIPAAPRPAAPRPPAGPSAATPPLRRLLLPLSPPRFAAAAASSPARLFHAAAVGGGSRWLASDASASAAREPSAELVEVPLAQTGEGIAECELLRWFVSEGDQVDEFQQLCEVQSDKATIEITSRFKGTVHQIQFAPGDIVKVGETLLKMIVNGSQVVPHDSKASSPDIPLGVDTSTSPSREGNAPRGSLSTPAVRHLVKQYGLNINDIQGTGRDGRVLKEDVLNYAASKGLLQEPPSALEEKVGQVEIPEGGKPLLDQHLYQDKRITFRGYQRSMVKSMTLAAKVPHFHYLEEINCDALVQLKASFQKENKDHDVKHTFLPFLIKSPEKKGFHNIGVAMATEQGLVVPSIKRVQSLSILEREMNTTMEARVCRNYTERWIDNHLQPRNNIYRVEGFMIMAAVFMIVLAIGAPLRRHCQSIIIRYGVEGVLLLYFPLLSYTLGLMQQQIIKNQLYLVWVMFLVMLPFGGTISMSIQKLGEYNMVKITCDVFLFVVYMLIVLNSFAYAFMDLLGRIGLVITLIFMGPWAGGITYQLWSAYLASQPMAQNGIEWLADYMKREHQTSTSYNPHTMQGYKYPVLIHNAIGNSYSPVTLDKIWCDNIGVLSSSNSPHIRRLKDLCLSFALFHLVVRRYFGYSCPESKLDKSRALVLDGLLQTEQDYERAFQVIEAELAFLYDFFFTKYAAIMYAGQVLYCANLLAITVLCIGLGTWVIIISNTQVSMVDDLLVETSTQDVVITIAAFIVLSIFQLLQLWSYYASDWVKVSFVCKYATHPTWQGNANIERLLLLLGRPHRWLRYWRNAIGQYSFLDFSSYSCWDQLKECFQSRKTGSPVELPVKVKKAVARVIKNSINGHISNGASTLMRHGMSDQLCWACHTDDEFTVTHSILVWHVATGYCEISETIAGPNENDVHPNRGVATSLSKYVAYLVACAPKLLPGRPITSDRTLDELEKQAKRTLRGLVSPRQKYEKLRELYNVVDEVPSDVADATATEATSAQLLSKGVRLGKLLESMENHVTRWDLLADFWAEMLVYIAPSDNVAGHIELLAEGGEFLTHVCALLMHAGILERPAATAIP